MSTTKGYGQVVSWTLRNVFVSREDLEQALVSHGLKMRVKKTEAATYLRRAIKQAINEGVIRKVGENAQRVSFAVVHEQTNLSEASWDGTQHEGITLNKGTGDISFKESGTLTRSIREALRGTEGGLLTSEVGAVLRNIVCDHCNGIALRDAGGVYFIPAGFEKLLDEAEVALCEVANVDNIVKIHRLGVIAGVREAQDIADIYEDTVTREVASIKQQAMALIKDLVRAKPSTFAKRASKLRKLMERLALYERTLGTEFGSARDAIGQLLALLVALEKVCRQKRAQERASR